jgi:serine protease Do
MKQQLIYKLMIAGVGLLCVPKSLLAQSDKEKIKEKTQTIVITRTGDVTDKTVIEVDGDKIKVNGKDVKDNKDVNVNVTTTTGKHTRIVTSPGRAMTFSTDAHGMNLIEEDDNRAMLGVTTEDHDKGAEIISVTQNGGAEKAGLKKGDVLTRIGDDKIEKPGDVTKAIRSKKPGEKVAVTYLREGKEQKATAELSKWKGIRWNTSVAAPRLPATGVGEPMIRDFDIVPMERSFYSMGRPRLGLSIQDDEDGKGAKVLDVDDESAAAKAGLKKGDIITGIDDKVVKGTDDVTRTMRDNRDKYTFSFKILREGKAQTLEVKMQRRLKTAEL